jgi:two-component system chemotaxis response regulator CheY
MAYNILVVDDSKVARAMVIRTLKMAEMDLGRVHEAGNGREALAVLDREWVDLVLADIHMPVMTGVQMVEEMSRNGLMDSIPVVIISTERSVTRIEELKAKGIRAYLRKPFTAESIRSVVEQVLAGSVPKAAGNVD